MPTEYFEQRERALLGQRYEQLYAAPQQTAERGVTVSALRTTPEQFAQRADFPLEPSPFCKAAFVVHQPDFKPGRHPYHHAGGGAALTVHSVAAAGGFIHPMGGKEYAYGIF